MKRFVIMAYRECPNCPKRDEHAVIGSCEFSDIAKELRDMVVTHGEDIWHRVYVLDTDTNEALHLWERK